MTEKTLQGFLEVLLHDENVRLEAGAAVSAVASKHGFDCTAAECAGWFRPAAGELGEDALTRVAGGIGTSVIGSSIGIRSSESYPTSMTGGSLTRDFTKG